MGGYINYIFKKVIEDHAMLIGTSFFFLMLKYILFLDEIGGANILRDN